MPARAFAWTRVPHSSFPSEGGSQRRVGSGNVDRLFAGTFRGYGRDRVLEHVPGRVAGRRACPRVPARPKMYPSRTRDDARFRRDRQHYTPHLQGFCTNPLTDSNRRPLLTMEVLHRLERLAALRRPLSSRTSRKALGLVRASAGLFGTRVSFRSRVSCPVGRRTHASRRCSGLQRTAGRRDKSLQAVSAESSLLPGFRADF